MLAEMETLNSTAQQAWTHIVGKYPSWADYFGICGANDLEVAVPAPAGSNAGHLVIFTNGDDLWLRYAAPYACYPLDDDGEMLRTIDQLLNDEALVVVTTRDEQWEDTTLIRRGNDPSPEAGQVARVVSWSGRYDKVVKG
jgi:hypothetical protein